MRHKLLTAILSVLCLAVMACAPVSAGAVTVGISDNSPAMFSNSYFNALNVHQARLIVPWNTAVLSSKTYLNMAKSWIKAAEADRVSPLIDFGGNGNTIPTAKQYTQAVQKFIRDFPSVKQYIPWNEPDWYYRSLSRNPKLAAAYFNALHQTCRGCSVLAGDLYLPASQLAPWIKSYAKYLKYQPAAWALHPYNDIQEHKTSQIQTMMRLVKGPIWLTEISGVVRRGHWKGGVLNQTLAKQAQDESFLFSLPKRFPRLTRIYHYQWQGTVYSPNTGWDSGLLNPNGTPRPAYTVVQKAAG